MWKIFERAYFRQTVRILAACVAAYIASRLIGLAEEYWAIVTAVVVTQPGLRETLRRIVWSICIFSRTRRTCLKAAWPG